jgi:hypothetical protein
MEYGGSPKKLFSTLFFNLEAFPEGAPKRPVLSPIQKIAPRSDAQTMHLCSQDAGLEILNPLVNDSVHLGEVCVESV